MAAVGLLAIASAAATAGCGGDSGKSARADCEALLAGLVQSLTEIDSRLDVGLSYSSYSDQVGDAKVEYDRIVDAGNSEPLRGESDSAKQCRQAATNADDALRHYVEGQRTWNDCIFDDVCGPCIRNCETADVLPDLRRSWGKARFELDRLEANLDDIYAD